ncbi:MAG: SGNH/GDSL hydrolase family protein [Flavobacteriaceae bacterium]|jgi:lysophospholipase L1-like esterase|nr:SGNH/GDSL hydrolase family protein [Flavobacteriaceae bacterium]
MKLIYKSLFGSTSIILLIVILSFKPNLPKVFVIGDSISIHYGPYLKKALSNFFIYDRKRDKGESLKDLDTPIGANGGDSNIVLNYLKELKNESDFSADYLLINCGLHDIKRKSSNEPNQVNFESYKKNLIKIIAISKQMKIKMVWINSTPVVDSIHNSKVPFYRFNKDLIKYNKAGDSIMLASKIPVIDLYTFTKKFIPDGYQDHVHFKEHIRNEQANFIAGNLTAIKNYKK